ncbi:hypothetical protein THASP1DRAFT_29705 [Thamnocephalis sphaerospora]|uniref:Uncharacterized protein n=1 Tax=Thamnocephalis sphaerospora TaxID=78915 RepID=A0A4P9XSU5_9FUNG|nr:hypothetical protein THASP1DRAFT_29705 [Thamnocephalis sphaerospora]|eukprot:RKP08480.1 hypothetical protein THASP1DRAFT_29705 [Thamnocephalis sphaerospora]
MSEACAALYIGTTLEGVSLEQPASTTEYATRQQQRLNELFANLGDSADRIPLLMVFWAHSGAPAETAFLHRTASLCSTGFSIKKTVIVSGPDSFGSFERHIEWLVEESKLLPTMQPHELILDFSDIFHWACARIARTADRSLPLHQPTLPAAQRKRPATSLMSALLVSPYGTYFELLVEVFNAELTALDQLVASLTVLDKQSHSHAFFAGFRLPDSLPLLDLDNHVTPTTFIQRRISQLATKAPWIAPSIATANTCGPMQMAARAFHEIEATFARCVEKHIRQLDVPLYASKQRRELLETLRSHAQQLLDRAEAIATQLSVPPPVDDGSPGISKYAAPTNSVPLVILLIARRCLHSRTVVTPSSPSSPLQRGSTASPARLGGLQQLKALVDDVQGWLAQMNPDARAP